MYQNYRRRDANYATRNEIHTLRNKIYAATGGGEGKAKCTEMYKEYCSLLDKAVKRGVIVKNTASRSKSRARLRLDKVAAK